MCIKSKLDGLTRSVISKIVFVLCTYIYINMDVLCTYININMDV